MRRNLIISATPQLRGGTPGARHGNALHSPTKKIEQVMQLHNAVPTSVRGSTNSSRTAQRHISGRNCRAVSRRRINITSRNRAMSPWCQEAIQVDCNAHRQKTPRGRVSTSPTGDSGSGARSDAEMEISLSSEKRTTA